MSKAKAVILRLEKPSLCIMVSNNRTKARNTKPPEIKTTNGIKVEPIAYFKKYMKIAANINFRQWTEVNDPRERENLVQDIRCLVSQIPKPVEIEQLKQVILSYGDSTIDEIIGEDDITVPYFSKVEPMISYFLFFGVPRRQLQLALVVKLRELISFPPIYDKTAYYCWKMFMLNNSHYISCEPTASILNLIVIAGYFNPLKIQSRLLDLQFDEDTISELSVERLVTKIEGYILHEFVDFLVDEDNLDTYRPPLPIMGPAPQQIPPLTNYKSSPTSHTVRISDSSQERTQFQPFHNEGQYNDNIKKEDILSGEALPGVDEEFEEEEGGPAPRLSAQTPLKTIYREASTQTPRYTNAATQTIYTPSNPIASIPTRPRNQHIQQTQLATGSKSFVDHTARSSLARGSWRQKYEPPSSSSNQESPSTVANTEAQSNESPLPTTSPILEPSKPDTASPGTIQPKPEPEGLNPTSTISSPFFPSSNSLASSPIPTDVLPSSTTGADSKKSLKRAASEGQSGSPLKKVKEEVEVEPFGSTEEGQSSSNTGTGTITFKISQRTRFQNQS